MTKAQGLKKPGMLFLFLKLLKLLVPSSSQQNGNKRIGEGLRESSYCEYVYWELPLEKEYPILQIFWQTNLDCMCVFSGLEFCAIHMNFLAFKHIFHLAD